jgi:DNA-binding transcriptional MerR regulator
MKTITRHQVTPILGPGFYEPMFGTLRAIAQRGAETYQYPMASHERESLPQVAQFLAINQYHGFPLEEFEDYLKLEIQDEHRDDLTDELLKSTTSLNQLIQALGAKWRERDPSEPSKVLAQLPLPIYITTNVHNLLGNALQEAGKDPQILLCPWNEYVEQSETIFDKEPDYYPSPQRPLVYHLFGRLNEPDSVVLTEDDYFDFLIGVTGNKDLIPPVVRRALSDSALLFLGYQMDEWNFRVLFRSLLSKQGGGRRDRYAHIAAQIEPVEGRILAPERARRYLETYFSKGADISIFWGSAQDFLKELLSHWNESPH